MVNKKRAFTLPEVIISMSIIVIVLALATTLVLVVAGITKKQNYMALCQSEYQNAFSMVDDFLNSYSYSPYYIKNVQTDALESVIQVSDNVNDYEVVYDATSNTLQASIMNNTSHQVEVKEIEFQNITKINFNVHNNIVKCEFFFEDYPTYTSIIKFGAE